MNYLGNLPEFYVIQNQIKFDTRKYENVIKESIVLSWHVDLSKASSIESQLSMGEIDDEVDMLDIGLRDSYKTWKIKYSPMRISSSNQFPKKYKIIGLSIYFNPDLEVI